MNLVTVKNTVRLVPPDGLCSDQTMSRIFVMRFASVILTILMLVGCRQEAKSPSGHTSTVALPELQITRWESPGGEIHRWQIGDLKQLGPTEEAYHTRLLTRAIALSAPLAFRTKTKVESLIIRTPIQINPKRASVGDIPAELIEVRTDHDWRVIVEDARERGQHVAQIQVSVRVEDKIPRYQVIWSLTYEESAFVEIFEFIELGIDLVGIRHTSGLLCAA